MIRQRKHTHTVYRPVSAFDSQSLVILILSVLLGQAGNPS